MKSLPRTSARYVNLLIECLEQQGLDCGDILAQLALERTTLAHPRCQLPPDQLTALLRLVADKASRSELSLMAGKQMNFGVLGDLGHAMLCSASPREALACCAEFYPLVTPHFTMQLRALSGHTEIRWQPIRAMPYDVTCMAFDMALGAFDRLIHWVLGDRVPPYDAYFTMAAPAHAAHYRRLTKARCHFGEPGLPSLRVEIADEALDAPSPLRHPGELAALRKRLRQGLDSALTPVNWTAWVTMMLQEAQDEQPTQAQVAAIVKLSASTLARHLAAEGTSFRRLANEVRHGKACVWLEEGRLLVADIALKLGYADTPSFVRAFKTMSGHTPGAYARGRAREAVAGGSASAH